MATPWDARPAGWLQLLALGTLVCLLDACPGPKRAGVLGWLFATAWLSGTFWWMFVAMHTYAGLAAWLAATAVLALGAVLSIYYGVASAAYLAISPKNSRVGAACVFAACWLLAEMARGLWFTGLGWGAAAYAHIDGLAHAAKYVGAYGVTALVALIAHLLAGSLRRGRNIHRAVAAGSVVALSAAMAWSPGRFTEPGPTLQVALLQGNIAQSEKFEAGTGVADSLRWYGQQLSSATASLVVAPETAIPLLPQQLPEGYWTGLQRRYGSGNQAVLLGIPLGSESQGYTNSVVGFKPGVGETGPSNIYRYDKHHLVPFGEFIPPFFRWFTRMMNIPLGDFNRGAVGQASFLWQGQLLAPNVCYEDLFGEELGARFIDAAAAPTIFVNLSNIAWFGNTVAIDQHLAISRMRALEFERPFIRATNTGDTAIIDYQANVTQALPRQVRGVLLGEVQGRHGSTPYAWWVSRFWLWPLWCLGVGVVLAALGAKLMRSRSNSQAVERP